MTTLYLKYRPQTLDELDLVQVRESLKKIVASGKIPHALLFYGPKGSGKTSAARIIAKLVNCTNPKANGEPCNKCEQCLSISKGVNIDVIELDAASHRGIDDVRMIKDAVKLSPAKAKKKVYIIDEAHMLTTEASNALLKTLEEPPEHVLFILATTNPEKLIDTIKSRTVNINFTKASDHEVIRTIERAAKGEKLKLDKNSLELIAKASDGSFREAHKIIESLLAKGGKFEKQDLEKELFSSINDTTIESIIEALTLHNVKKAIEEIENVVNSGAKIDLLTAKLIDRFRNALFSKMDLGGADIKEFSKQDLTKIIELLNKSYGQIPRSYLEQIPLELALIKFCENELRGKPQKIEVSSEQSKKKGTKANRKEKDVKKAGGIKRQMNSNGEISSKVLSNGETLSDEIWKEILLAIKPKNTSTEALLRAAKPLSFDGKRLTLGVYYSFHKERLEEFMHKQILEEVAAQVLGNSVKVECELTEPPKRPRVEDTNINTNGDYVSNNDVSGVPEVVVSETEPVLTEPEDEDIIKIAKEIFGN